MSDPIVEADEPRVYRVEPEEDAQRLDVFLSARLPEYSRTLLRRAIDAGQVLVDGERTKVAYRLVAGQQVTIQTPDLPRDTPIPENIPLALVHEDEHLIVVDKPPGMVVHPAKGHWSGTLTAGLAYHFQQLSSVGGPTRPGIVHRLDRDTTGVMVVAKTDPAHARLAAQFEAREVRKEYLAICRGVPDRDRDHIRQPIGIHPQHRTKMAIRADHETSRDAHTEYMVEERFEGFSLLRAYPKTGRTHQIRVHLTHIGLPILCDRLYASHDRITMGDVSRTQDPTVLLDRQALHAARLELTHPITGEHMTFGSPLPADLAGVLDALRTWRQRR